MKLRKKYINGRNESILYTLFLPFFMKKERKGAMKFITKEESEKLSNRMKQLSLQYERIAKGIEASQIINNAILELNANSKVGIFITVKKYQLLMGFLDMIFQEAEKGTFIVPLESSEIIKIWVHHEI